MNLHLHPSKTGRVGFALGVLAVGALAGIWMAAAFRKAHEPVHKGKSIGTWIAEMYSKPNDVTARDELTEMGAPAIPYLIREVRRDGGLVGPWYGRCWLRMPSGIQRLLPAPPNYLERRSAAADTLGKFGAAASNAVPALIGCLQVPGYQPLRFSAAVTLGRIGAPARAAIPALMQALKDQDFNVRMEAAMALAKIGRDYSQATPQLEALLRDAVAGVRLRAALALWRLQPKETTASNRVAQVLLEDPDPALRSWAAFLLGDLGPTAAAFSPALREALRDPDSRVQQNANSSLQKLRVSVQLNQENRKSE